MLIIGYADIYANASNITVVAVLVILWFGNMANVSNSGHGGFLDYVWYQIAKHAEPV